MDTGTSQTQAHSVYLLLRLLLSLSFTSSFAGIVLSFNRCESTLQLIGDPSESDTCAVFPLGISTMTSHVLLRAVFERRDDPAR